jgi:type VI secretion system secreted protein Hcp
LVLAVPAVQRNLGPTSLAPPVFLASPQDASSIFLQLGDIKGESTDKDHKDWLQVSSFSWGAPAPRDLSTGMATGKRQHQDITITKYSDKASPKLFRAMGDGSVIPSATLTFLRAKPTPELFTYVLTNVFVSSLRPIGSSGSDGPFLEEITLTFEKIVLTRTPVKTTALDDWHLRQ